MKIGAQIPEFPLKDRNGTSISSHSFIGKKKVVVYFYPKDETKVCTAQACAFRDSFQDFLDLGCEVIGISSDSDERHQQFMSRHKLPFILVSDPQKEIRKLFGVPKDVFGLLPGRYTYIFNRDGILIKIFHAAFNANAHITTALDVLSN